MATMKAAVAPPSPSPAPALDDVMDCSDKVPGKSGLGLDSGFPFWVASRRRRAPGDAFFASGDTERELLAKHVALDLSEEDRYQLQKMEAGKGDLVFCPISGCRARLDCLEAFEDHYIARHTASCSVCSRVYPTTRLLSIHVSEAHDSFFKAKVARGFPMYECLVENCDIKFKSYKSRKQHLIDKHRFPKSFEFYKKAHPSKHQRKKHQQKHAGHKTDSVEAGMDVDGKPSKQKHSVRHSRKPETKDAGDQEMDIDNIDDLASAVSKVSISSPSSVSFGHRHSRGFAFVPRSLRQKKPTPHPE